MGDAMVTGRMSADKKRSGAKALQRSGLTASQAINRLYERLAEEGNADFLFDAKNEHPGSSKWTSAARFVDSLSQKRESRFHSMTNAEITMDRLRSRGLA